jgi:tetratricopeptide (TPR) repeat protein
MGFGIAVLKDSVIIHQVYMSDDDFLASKQRRYLNMIEHELSRDDRNFWMLYQQAKTCWFLDEKEKAKNIFSVIAYNKDCPLIIQCSAFCNKAVLLLEEGKYADALTEVDKSLQLIPQQSLGMMIKGNIFYQMDQFKKSIGCYRKVKTTINKLQYNQVIPGDLYVKPEEIKYKIACCYLAMGKTAAARFLIKRALRINDKHVPSLLVLAKLYAAKKNTVLAKEYTLKCLALNPGWKQAEYFLESLSPSA